MSYPTLASALLAIALGGCIESRTTADDPEADAIVDAGLADAHPTDLAVPMPFEPGPEHSPGCEAVPTCPPGYDRVQTCEPGAVCETVMECGDSILCQVCPPGAGFICEDGTYEVDECTNDATCFEISDCGGSIACESCDVCPEGMMRVPECPPDTACHQCDGDGDGIFPICAPEQAVRCPPETVQVDDCLEGDPLCWVVEGVACASVLCPVRYPCGGEHARSVDRCADDALGCYERAICGDEFVCEVISHDCDDCEPACPAGFSQVDRCAPNGRACLYITECCSELFCQRDP